MIPGTKCLGRDVERPRPGGTVEVIVSPTGIGRRNWAHAALENVSATGSIVPLGRVIFPHDSRHLVPGDDHAVPLEQNTFSGPRLD